MGEPTILVLDCGTMRPPLVGLRAATICLAVETSAGWVLVDSGFGTRDFVEPCRRMRLWRFLFGLDPHEQQAAVHRLAALGVSARDVRHVILTHLHFDHAGGLRDFPQARVHLLRSEWEAARRPRTLLEFGYLPVQWSHQPAWVFHDAGETHWHGRPAARLLPGVTPELLLVPLPGHTRGHCGVAVQTPAGWLFLAGDAASPFHPGSDVSDPAQAPYPMRWLPEAVVRRVLGPHVPWLRELAARQPGSIEILSSHDPRAWARHNPRWEAALGG